MPGLLSWICCIALRRRRLTCVSLVCLQFKENLVNWKAHARQLLSDSRRFALLLSSDVYPTRTTLSFVRWPSSVVVFRSQIHFFLPAPLLLTKRGNDCDSPCTSGFTMASRWLHAVIFSVSFSERDKRSTVETTDPLLPPLCVPPDSLEPSSHLGVLACDNFYFGMNCMSFDGPRKTSFEQTVRT